MKEKKKFYMPVLRFLIFCVIVYGITHYLVGFFHIPSPSMETTIMTGEMVVGNRLAYKNTSPERGDIVVFHCPVKPELYIKRVIGLPEETLSIKDGCITICTKSGKNICLKEPYLPEKWMEKNTDMTFHIPKDSYLLLGDNRNNSYDARYWKTPYVKKKDIVAKAEYIVFPRIKKMKGRD